MKFSKKLLLYENNKKRNDWQVIQDSTNDVEQVELPLLVYVSREKRPSRPHHFKAGALNVLV